MSQSVKSYAVTWLRRRLRKFLFPETTSYLFDAKLALSNLAIVLADSPEDVILVDIYNDCVRLEVALDMSGRTIAKVEKLFRANHR